MNEINPFPIAGYLSPEYFCDRDNEKKRLVAAIKNQRNLTLISQRRMGKTGLINHVFHFLKRDRSFALFYFDILSTTNLTDFTKLFAKTVVGKIDSTPVNFFKSIGKFFSNIKSTFVMDPMTGRPSIEFSLEAGSETIMTLEKIFQYISRQKKTVVIAIDEFQQIVHYPEKNTEALLRTHIQKANNCRFVYSGSHKHLLMTMFSNHGRPFYQSTEIMHLGKIDIKTYSTFIKSKFTSARRKISDDAIAYILQWTKVHTFYVQFVCNRLYTTGEKNITTDLINKVLLDSLMEYEVYYYNYRNLLTDYQWQLLRSIALEDEVKMPTSKEFMQKNKLGTPSSVQAALTALIEREVVYYENGKYSVNDVLLSRWFSRI
ncbi:MAG: ATP-binding protein [Bacteroidia bacterium]